MENESHGSEQNPLHSSMYGGMQTLLDSMQFLYVMTIKQYKKGEHISVTLSYNKKYKKLEVQ